MLSVSTALKTEINTIAHIHNYLLSDHDQFAYTGTMAS